MPLPSNLVLIRHGLSEANIVQKGHEGFTDNIPESFFERHDAFMRLTPTGAEQAAKAGAWLRENGYVFDKFYTSPHMRTRETAANLGLGGFWAVDDLLRERDWGEVGRVHSRERQLEAFPESFLLKQQHPWYWKPAGGESLATGVRSRVNGVLQRLSLHRTAEWVVAVTHGEFIRTAQFVLERLTPEEWVRVDDDKSLSITNCMIVHYSMTDPVTGENYHRYKWVRQINPMDVEASPYGGKWRELSTTLHSDEDLLASVNGYPRIF